MPKPYDYTMPQEDSELILDNNPNGGANYIALIEKKTREYQWREIYYRVGGHLRNDKQLLQMLWRSKKQRNIRKGKSK